MTTRPRSVTRARAVAAGGLTATVLLLLTACGAGGNDRTEGDGPQTTFKIGYTAGSILDEKLAKEVAKLAPDHGITVEPVQIEDSKLKNLAVSQGDIDANHSQHQEWMRVQNEDGNLGLYAAGDWYVLKFSGYSEKYDKLEDLPKGAKVAIPDDPSNQAQALQTLQDLGQLTLKDGVDPSRVTIRDVKDNPKSFEFTEAALAQLPRTLPDVDLALGWRSNFDLADVPDDKIVFNAPAYELYWIEVVINEKNKDNPDFAPLLDTYHDPRIGQLIDSDPFFSRVAQSIESARATDRSQTNVDGAAREACRLMSGQREVILNVNVLDVGFHPSAWRAPDLHPTSFIDPDYYTEVAQIAERGTLDALFLADGPALREDPAVKPTRALEPTPFLGVVASATEHLGLIGTASTTFNDPVELADRFLSLDVVSGGRVAWNVVTTFHAGTAHNFGLSEIPDRESRYRRATEFVDVVTALWVSATTQVPVHHDGEYFHVHGVLPVPPSPQRHPLLVQAGGSPQGRALAGRSADAVFSAELTLDAGRQHYREVKDVARADGRDPGAVKILPGLVTVVGSTEAEAIARYEDWESKAADGFSAERLGGMLGVDLSSLDPDRPIPEDLLLAPVDPSFSGSLGFREAVVRLALESRYSVSELLRKAGGFGHRLVVGSPEQIADTIEAWFLAGAADGFNLMPDGFPSGLTDFVDHVVPLLREKGIFRYEYAESTLRERFEGAPLPVSG